MKKIYRRVCSGAKKKDGFSLMEVIVAIAIMAILFAIALPPFLEWRRNLVYKQAAKQITSVLSEARSMAITRNLQHMVVINPVTNSYQMTRGDRSFGTTSFGYAAIVAQNNFPAGVTIRSGDGGTLSDNVNVQFNANGTAVLSDPDGNPSNGNVWVTNAGVPKYRINVATTGRISLEKK